MARRYRKKTRLFVGSGISGRRLKRWVTFFLLLAVGAGGGILLKGRVVSVADGDSLSIFSGKGVQERVRLYGIDCPELAQNGGEEARAFTRSLVFLEEVRLNVMDTDKYERSVAVVTLADGRILNEELVKNGHAWVYGAFCDTPRCLYWRGLEKQAKAQKLGLWRDKKPLPPWIWRKRKP
jgi:endonuclease YncB( thermonuclease family)